MNYSVSDIAENLEVAEYTVRKLIKRFKLENTGFFIQTKKNINVLYYPENTYLTIKAEIDANKEIENNFYTTRQIAELIGVTVSCVSSIALRYKIDKKVLIAEKSRVAYFSKESLEKFRNILDKMQNKRAKWQQKKTETTAAIEEAAALHPLVTDKRCLNLNWWPDVIPECFKEISA